MPYDDQEKEPVAAISVPRERSAATALESEAELRTSFLSVAAHELRTPLQPILGYLYLMIESPDRFGLNEEGVQFLNAILECANRMADIVNRTLVVSFADAGRKPVHPCQGVVSLERLAMDVVRACNTGDGTTYSIDIPPDTMIETDWKYLYEALYEICVNAVKHSDPPRHVTFRYDEDSEVHIITVSDNGPGMDEETLKNLFQPFYIGDRGNLSRSCGRLGLGLTIAKRDIEILGGTISVDSALHQGSTFTIKIPRRPL
jgi:signal transduction histidine kinase